MTKNEKIWKAVAMDLADLLEGERCCLKAELKPKDRWKVLGLGKDWTKDYIRRRDNIRELILAALDGRVYLNRLGYPKIKRCRPAPSPDRGDRSWVEEARHHNQRIQADADGGSLCSLGPCAGPDQGL